MAHSEHSERDVSSHFAAHLGLSFNIRAKGPHCRWGPVETSDKEISIFSSHDAQSDLSSIYPGSSGIQWIFWTRSIQGCPFKGAVLPIIAHVEGSVWYCMKLCHFLWSKYKFHSCYVAQASNASCRSPTLQALWRPFWIRAAEVGCSKYIFNISIKTYTNSIRKCVSSFLCFNPLRHVTQSFALTERQFSHAAASLHSEAQGEAQNVGHSGNELTSSLRFPLSEKLSCGRSSGERCRWCLVSA